MAYRPLLTSTERDIRLRRSDGWGWRDIASSMDRWVVSVWLIDRRARRKQRALQSERDEAAAVAKARDAIYDDWRKKVDRVSGISDAMRGLPDPLVVDEPLDPEEANRRLCEFIARPKEPAP